MTADRDPKHRYCDKCKADLGTFSDGNAYSATPIPGTRPVKVRTLCLECRTKDIAPLPKRTVEIQAEGGEQ